MDKISVMFTQDQISSRIDDIAARISEDYKGRDLLLLCVLSGAFMFSADLMRRIDNENMEICFIRAKSYVGTESSGNVAIHGLDKSIKGRNVLIAEDIIDTGRTLKELTGRLLSLGAESVKTAVLLDKPGRRAVEMQADYCCFEIEDKFVVGCGLDCDEKYRGLPYVGYIAE